MPFLPRNLWKSDPVRGALDDEVARLASDARVHQLFDWFTRHEREIADFQLAITAVPAPPFGEQRRAHFLRERLEALGLATAIDAAGNLLAMRGGLSFATPAIAFTAHLDTVFPAETPLDVRREQCRLLGPGISDNGAGLAALWALASALESCELRTAAPLLWISNVGEEGEGNLRGMRHLFRADALADPATPPAIAMAVVMDGAGCNRVITQALGSRRFEVSISGPGGHSWSDFGVPNPIVAAAIAIRALFRIPLPNNPRTTLNVGRIEGGTSVNAIPERVLFRVDFRSSDRARIDELEQHLRRLVSEACAEVEAQSPPSRPRLSHTITLTGERPAGDLAESSPLLAAIRAVDAHLGIDAPAQRASTDANIPLSLGLEAISVGAGGSGGGAHTVQEWYDPAGRELSLKRLALLALLLAGLPEDASCQTAEPA